MDWDATWYGGRGKACNMDHLRTSSVTEEANCDIMHVMLRYQTFSESE